MYRTRKRFCHMLVVVWVRLHEWTGLEMVFNPVMVWLKLDALLARLSVRAAPGKSSLVELGKLSIHIP